ncbi:SRPBCC family protein [Parashewanella tropica]|uniref:SRPBCC family protein n=1 Tax=Parashewanella tropica TaxID=2547970 RepID=UPI00105A15F0|nr:SRPBCC family protein [Parashewanella tropica]
MKALLIIIGIILVVFLAGWLWGSTLPATHKVTVNQKINAPINQVWEAMTDWKKQPRWRAELKSVDVISETKFIELPSYGPEIIFDVLDLKKPNRFELQMSGSIEGRYITKLSFENGVTNVTATEIVIQKSPIKRVITYLFFDLNAFAQEYMQQLKIYVEAK